MANVVFREALRAHGAGEMNWATDTIKAALYRISDAVAQRDAANFLTDLTHTEYVGANYVAGGETLTGKAIVEATQEVQFDASDVVWTALGADAGGPAIGLLVYKFVTGPGDSVPIAWIDTGGFPKNGTGSDFTVSFNAAGVWKIASS